VGASFRVRISEKCWCIDDVDTGKLVVGVQTPTLYALTIDVSQR
jgi:hypothetical protein